MQADMHPFPSLGNLDSQGVHHTVHENLHGLKKKEYQALCRKYSLPHSYGNIPDLKQRLLNFSGNKGSWAALVPGNICAHLGPRGNSKTKKGSTKRWEAKSASVMTVDGPQISNEHKGMSPLAWAAQVFSMASPPTVHPVRAFQMCLQKLICRDQVENGISSRTTPSIAQPAAQMDDGNDAELMALQCLTSLEPTLSRMSAVAAPNMQSRFADSGSANHIPIHSPSLSVASPPYSQTVPKCLVPREAVEVRCLFISGQKWLVQESQVPDPPGFSSQLRGPMDKVVRNVLSWWDDRLPEWDPNRALLKIRINGTDVGIPGILWKQLYAAPWKAKQWAGLKGRYSELLCMVNYYRQLREGNRMVEFWSAVTTNVNGDPRIMPYSTAIRALRRSRQEITQEQAAELLRDPKFADGFSYKRGGKAVTMRNASAIVRRVSRSKAFP
ncbi:hypothetical protein C8R47DRAFT_1072896 [Mycena vitilis]|nr:hypothetical protein C8R47DRAFT_1072896 [Mycena vitilis]